MADFPPNTDRINRSLCSSCRITVNYLSRAGEMLSQCSPKSPCACVCVCVASITQSSSGHSGIIKFYQHLHPWWRSHLDWELSERKQPSPLTVSKSCADHKLTQCLSSDFLYRTYFISWWKIYCLSPFIWIFKDVKLTEWHYLLVNHALHPDSE